MADVVEIEVVLPNTFIASMKKLMETMERLLEITDKIKTPQVQAPLVQRVVARLPNELQAKFKRIEQLFRKLSEVLERSMERIIGAMGSFGKLFLRTLSVAGMVASFAITAGYEAIKISVIVFRSIWDKLVGLGDSMLQDHLISTGMMGSIGGLRAYRTAFGQLPLDSGLYSNFAEVRGSIVSQQYLALKFLGVKNFADTADMMVAATLAAARFMKRQSKGIELLTAVEMGLTSLFSPQTLQVLLNMDEEELRQREQKYQEDKEKFKISDETRLAWVNFSLQVRAFWIQVESVIARKLADSKFIRVLDDLSKAFIKFIRGLMNTKLSERIIFKLKDALTQFGDWLAGDGPMRLWKKVKTLTIEFMSVIKTIIQELIRLKNVFSPVSTAHAEEITGRGVTFRAGIKTHPESITPGAGYPRRRAEPVKPEEPVPPPAPRQHHVRRLGPDKDKTPVTPRRLALTPGQAKTLYDPITGTSLGGGVGSTSASMGAGRHQGDDIMAPYGSPVYAVEDGEIYRIGHDNFGKLAVTIKHTDGTFSRYLHMSRIDLKVGTKVKGGEQIGASGRANGVNHLHFERWTQEPNRFNKGLMSPRKEFGWDKGNLPKGGQPSRTSTNQPPPPANPAKPSAEQQQPPPPARVVSPSTSANPRPAPPSASTSATPRGARTLRPYAYPEETPRVPPGWKVIPEKPAPGDLPAMPNSLSQDRQKYIKEMEDHPEVKERLFLAARNEQGEHPEGIRGIMESAMNRASVRHTTLGQQLHSTYEGKIGYYKHMPTSGTVDPRKRQIYEDALTDVAGGSNLSRYATENSSADVAAHAAATVGLTAQLGAPRSKESFSPPPADQHREAAYNEWKARVSGPGGDPRGIAAAVAAGGTRGGGGYDGIPWQAPPKAQFPTDVPIPPGYGPKEGVKPQVSADGKKPPMIIFRGKGGGLYNESEYETNARRIAAARGMEPVFIDARNPAQAAAEARQKLADRGNPQFGVLGYSQGASSAQALMNDPNMRSKNIETITIAPFGPAKAGFGNLGQLGDRWHNYADPSSTGVPSTGMGHDLNEKTEPGYLHRNAPGIVADDLESSSRKETPQTPEQEQPSGGLISPFPGITDFRIKSDNVYGASRSGGRRPHSGNDLHAPNGTDVVSMNDGVVLYNGRNQGYNANIVIKGSDGVIRRYATHAATENLPPGTHVRQGQKIGTVGEGHVHYEEIPPDLNGKPNAVYKEFERNASSNTFTDTSSQRGTIDPSGPKGTLQHVDGSTTPHPAAPVNKPVEQVKAKPIEHLRAPFSAGEKAEKKDVEDHPINKFKVENKSDQDVTWQSVAAGAL